MLGKEILHYRIIEKLGEGGMGVVYLAEDTKLKRQVAIKFLPHHVLANTDERQRFQIEAQAAAALNHPNIAHIYAIEEVDDELFIVMEYIEGKELKELINTPHVPPRGGIKGGVSSMESTLPIATQIAEGLQAAHKKGIVHRDIKSSNIMITPEGKVKIMDFGLAKMGKGVQLTREHSTLGTAAYMSPEQAKNEEVDQRTDIWSYGILLYEMLCGKMPFSGDYEAAILYSILHDQPRPISELTPDVSEGISNLIDKCLQKEKDRRYQSVSDILSDLKRVQADISQKETGPVSIPRETVEPDESRLQTNLAPKSRNKSRKPWVLAGIALLILVVVIVSFIYFPDSFSRDIPAEKKMLVVLPFENLGSAEQEYFADGITGEITSRLSGLSGLGVIARSSAMQYKNTQKSLQQIGEELGVQYVLEGTIQWEKLTDVRERVRVNPELIRIDNTTQIWSKPYEADFSSAFKLQADIAATVAEALNVTLIRSEKQYLNEKITENSEAYDTYLRALNYTEIIDDEKGLRIAEQLLLKAVSLDEKFSAAYAKLSSAQSDMYWMYFERSEENLNKSRTNAQKALSLDLNLPEAHIAMANYYYHGRLAYESALKEYHEALRLQPSNVEANNGIGFVLRRQGKMREAVASLEKSMALDPRDYNTVWSIGETYVLLREYEKALSFLDQALSLNPASTHPYYFKALIYLYNYGDVEKARSIILSAREKKIGLDSSFFVSVLYLCDILQRNFSSALTQVEGIKQIDDQFNYMSEDLLVALVYRLMNNPSQAKKYFESAVQNLEEKIKQQADDSRLYSSLGLAYAGMGRKAEAIREGRYAVELLPVSREAWRGSFRLRDLAQIYTFMGEQELALDAIEELIESPTDALSVWLLKLDPTWDPLRGNSRFQKLIKEID